jgi:hypothetical protein
VAGSPAGSAEFPGLTGIRAKPLARVPIRTRGSNVTLSAWRLELSSDQGHGAIVIVEGEAEKPHYRGEGACLGWPQQRLAAVYAALLPREGETDMPTPQLG